MKKFLVAVALATALSAGAASAQSDTAEMTEGLTMLETGAAKELTKIRITDVDVMDLSLSQLAQIKSVLESSDYNVNEMKNQVMSIVATN
ncbi:MAG: hypothetical protein H0T41_06155 [Rhodobacteraceae bacterium]|nr:hypothetical protein [Paracoccaceae bacterium]